MLGNRNSGWLVVVAGAAFGGFTAIWLLDFAVVRRGWCGEEPAAVCARNWIGSFSGWAAAIAAAATILILYRQLMVSRQIRNDQMNLELQKLIDGSRAIANYANLCKGEAKSIVSTTSTFGIVSAPAWQSPWAGTLHETVARSASYNSQLFCEGLNRSIEEYKAVVGRSSSPLSTSAASDINEKAKRILNSAERALRQCEEELKKLRRAEKHLH